MALQDEIQQILAQKDITPLNAFNKSRDLLRPACAKGGECDPLGANAEKGHYAYMAVANALEGSGFFAASESLLLEWWNDFGLRQREERQRVNRAVIAFKLTGLYLGWGDKGAGLRWALLTHADDILGNHPTGGGAGKQQLRTIFGMSESELERLDRIAHECREEVIGAGKDDWSRSAGFPEEIIRRFAQTEGAHAHLLVEASSFREFPLSPAYFRSLLECVDAAGTAKEKGDALEDLAYYLFLLLPGCAARRNLLDLDRAFESDIVVRNLNQAANLTAELLGRHFLVECKNWEETVGVRDVGYFLYRMRLTHAGFGIMFSKSGISGDDSGKAARALIRRAFHEDGSVCVVVAGSDLEKLATGASSFWWMLLEKIEDLRFGKPRGEE